MAKACLHTRSLTASLLRKYWAFLKGHSVPRNLLSQSLKPPLPFFLAATNRPISVCPLLLLNDKPKNEASPGKGDFLFLARNFSWMLYAGVNNRKGVEGLY